MLAIVESRCHVVSSTFQTAQRGLTLHQNEIYWYTAVSKDMGKKAIIDNIPTSGVLSLTSEGRGTQV